MRTWISSPRNHVDRKAQKTEHGVTRHNPKTGEIETGWFLGLKAQSTQPIQQALYQWETQTEAVAEEMVQSVLAKYPISSTHVKSKARAYNSSTVRGQAERSTCPERPLRLAGQTVIQINELWASARDPTSKSKVESEKGRHPAVTSGLHTHGYTSAHEHINTYAH